MPWRYVNTVPRHPTLTCLVEETAITIHLTQDGGGADTFNLACTDCTDTMIHEGLFSLRFTNLVPFSTYTFSATTLAGSQPGNRKESEAAERKCTASVGRKLLLHVRSIMHHMLVCTLLVKQERFNIII